MNISLVMVLCVPFSGPLLHSSVCVMMQCRIIYVVTGNYRAGFMTDSETHRVRFDYDNFVMAQRVTLHAYLNDMRHLQLFRQASG